MERTAINPWNWSLNLGYNQGEVIEGTQRHLVCAGQTSVDAHGQPQHLDDMRGQMALCLENLQAVLTQGGMGFRHLVKLTVYTTDVDEALKHFDLLGRTFGEAGVAPPMTLLGVSRLALPGLMFEIEALAAE